LPVVLVLNVRPKRDEMAGGWITLHIEELHNLYASLNIIGESSQGG